MQRIGLFCLLVIFIFLGVALAGGEPTPKTAVIDNLIGSTFKTLGKAFVTTVNLERLKRENIKKIKKMDDAKFNLRYAKVYATVKDYPFFARQYGLGQTMTRREAVIIIGNLDKQKVCEAIDNIPNALIATQFKLYLVEKKQEIQKNDVVAQVIRFWDRVTAKFYRRKK